MNCNLIYFNRSSKAVSKKYFTKISALNAAEKISALNDVETQAGIDILHSIHCYFYLLIKLVTFV